MDRDPTMLALIASFVNEARDICRTLTRDVLELESTELDPKVRQKRYDDLARGLHTLKGNSDTFGFGTLADLTHQLEDLIDPLRAAQAPIPPRIADVLLRAIDVFVGRIGVEVTRGVEALPPLDDLLGEIETLARGLGPRPRTAATLPALGAARDAADAVEEADDADDGDLRDGWRVGTRHVTALMTEIERLREIRLRLDERRREVGRAVRAVARLPGIDTGEARTLLGALGHGLATDVAETADLIDSLETEVRAIATKPLATILDPLRRAVRDLCRTLGKEARLAVVGAELTLDRRILEALKGPLVHLVRNAVDHGLEAPLERNRIGKHREGTIVIRAEQHGNLLVLEIEDDGAGIDLERVRAQAVARGLVTTEEAEQLEPRELHHILFRTGFSTRDEVTEVSGRGIGLDVVRSKVQALAGSIEVHSTPKQGTRFVLTVPAELGSTAVLVVRCDEQQLGIPMLAIETLRRLRPIDVKAGRTTVRVDHHGQLVPLLDLGALVGLRPPGRVDVSLPALIVQARGKRVALLADELVGDRDLVVRPLPLEVKDVAAYVGAATLAHGELLLVLAPEFLVAAPSAERPLAAARRVLVVDDSLTARALHRTILESGAYAVDTVGSARQALEHLRSAWYDAVVADVRMAGMDGFDLVAELRARPDTRELPVLLVSAHDTEAERARGLAAGADGFLSKKECISGRLLAEVASLIARRDRTLS